jgi:transcriptional regulator with XRE-family HTH domain
MELSPIEHPCCRDWPAKLGPDRYRAIRKHLGYSNYAFRKVLGLSLRQAQRYESGACELPLPVIRLLWLLERFGVPVEWGIAPTERGRRSFKIEKMGGGGPSS